jgi:hypothetical protein
MEIVSSKFIWLFKQSFSFFLIAIGVHAFSQSIQPQLKQHITYLASDSLHGRMTGSADEKLASDYIVKQFVKSGVKNFKGNFKPQNYLQQFTYTQTVDSAKHTTKGNNVVAFINNKSANTVVIGAHYDHLGMGLPHHSRYRGEPEVHNGADDNASGVAAVLELAKILKQPEFINNNYLLITFSGEELGLYGSKWFVEHSPVPLTTINYMLNFDMIGRVDSNKVVISGVGTSPNWSTVIKSIKSPFRIVTTESGVGPSDHTSFYLKNIPVLHFFSGQHKDYHMPTDDESLINYKGLEGIVDFTAALIKENNGKEKLAFTKTKDEDNENTPKFTVTLGVMPDYTFDGEGMRIDAVTENKPAYKAGIEAGDIVIKMGEVEVNNMTDYMKALSKFKKGDKTIVNIKRKGVELQKEVLF